MYFTSRLQAGRMLANQLAPSYTSEPCAVVALNDGGVMVGAQIAMRLHCVLTMLLTNEVKLPREPNSIGGVTQNGVFSYNRMYSAGEIDEMVGEYHNYIDQQKFEKLHEINHQTGDQELICKDLLQEHNVILVADGLSSGFTLDMAADFLKPIAIKRMIVATPLASISAVDRMHILADEIACLSVVEDYISTDHYYETKDVPSHETAIQAVERIVEHWK